MTDSDFSGESFSTRRILQRTINSLSKTTNKNSGFSFRFETTHISLGQFHYNVPSMMPGRLQLQGPRNYCIAASAYGCARMARRTQDAQICATPTAKRRPMLATERALASILCAGAAVYLAPMYVYDDLCSLESLMSSHDSPEPPAPKIYRCVLEAVCDVPHVLS